MRNAQVLFVASMGAAVAAALMLASGGCGSNTSTGPTGPSSSSSGSTTTSSSSSGSTTTGSSSSSSGGGSSSGTSVGSGSGAACGLNCPSTTAGTLCCAQRTGAVPSTTCTPEADCADGGALECVSPADCPSGQICCGASGSTQPLGTKCLVACAPSGALSRQVCQTPTDCPDLTYTCPTNSQSRSDESPGPGAPSMGGAGIGASAYQRLPETEARSAPRRVGSLPVDVVQGGGHRGGRRGRLGR
jgi:hypothetical protein